jgi:hypothetical protein
VAKRLRASEQPWMPATVTTCSLLDVNSFDSLTNPSSEQAMSSVKLYASTILGAFEQAQSELVGKAVVLSDGKAGTVDNVWLDELHGLRISVAGHVGKWPVSTVKLVQG